MIKSYTVHVRYSNEYYTEMYRFIFDYGYNDGRIELVIYDRDEIPLNPKDMLSMPEILGESFNKLPEADDEGVMTFSTDTVEDARAIARAAKLY